MATLYTYAMIQDKLSNDLDLINEAIVPPNEMLGYMNEALETAETAIHNLGLGDNYFKTFDWITLVPGQLLYNFPVDIYANKILKMFYNSAGPANFSVPGYRKYEVKRLRNVGDSLAISPGQEYCYDIINNQQSAGGNQLQILPVTVEAGQLIQRYYIRELRRLTVSTTDPYNVCELPASVNYLFQHCKWRVAKKRRIADMIAMEESSLKVEYALMQDTLREMVPDCNNMVQGDLSSYMEQEMDRHY